VVNLVDQFIERKICDHALLTPLWEVVILGTKLVYTIFNMEVSF
jgi:hypothetical protein